VFTSLTRKYTAPELVEPIAFGISASPSISDTVAQQFEEGAGRHLVGGINSSVSYASLAEYYYFFSDPNIPYTLEYQNSSYNESGTYDDTLTYVNVGLYDSDANSPIPNYIASVSGYPGQYVYGSPNGSVGGAVESLVTVEITGGSYSGAYKLKIDPPEAYTVAASPAEESKTIRQGTSKFYTFTPNTGTLYYALFQQGANANISVVAYINGSAGSTNLTGTGAYNGSAFTPTSAAPVILAVRETSWASPITTVGYTFRVATPTPLPLGPNTGLGALTPGSIRYGTSQYYITGVTPGTSYNLVFRDVGSADSASYANVSVIARYSNTTTSGTFATGNILTTYTVNPPGAPNAGWVILQVTENSGVPFSGTQPFGIKLYP
jgi:hypothetical protein